MLKKSGYWEQDIEYWAEIGASTKIGLDWEDERIVQFLDRKIQHSILGNEAITVGNERLPERGLNLTNLTARNRNSKATRIARSRSDHHPSAPSWSYSIHHGRLLLPTRI